MSQEGKGEKRGEVALKGRYRLLRTLGRGAMGTVFLAHDSVMDRQVAVKILRLPQGLSQAAREEVVQRFYREARLAGRLIHPNIVATFDIDRHGDHHFIIMEFMEGKTLATVLEEGGPLDEATALRVALQVCRALEHAHAHGVVHRDIKPGNIFISPSGDVKVGDFGIARSVDTATVTQTGYSMGTPQYMSPEQVRGEPLDPRSDLFSLGVVLYEMVAGRNPFAADSHPTVIYNILEKEPSLDAEAGFTRPEVREIIMRSLRKQAIARYANAREMASDLERALDAIGGGAEQGLPVSATPDAVGSANAPAVTERVEHGGRREQRHGEWQRWAGWAAALLVAAGAALAVILVAVSDGGETVTSRPYPGDTVEAFLVALRKGDSGKAYELLTPRAREELDLEALTSRMPDAESSEEITGLECKVVEERERNVFLEVRARGAGKKSNLGMWVLYWDGTRWLVERPGMLAYAAGG